MSIPRRAFFRVLRKGAKVAAWAVLLSLLVSSILPACGGRTMFRPKPPLEELPSKPKFVPSP